MTLSRDITPDALAALLARRAPSPSFIPGRSAAVLVPFCAVNGEPHLVITRRTKTVSTHKGQYAFPGGRRDPEDRSLVDTARREAHEEIGLLPSDVRVLGQLDDMTTSSGYNVTPVVGWVPHPYAFQLSAHEVDVVVTLPLEAFIRPVRARTLLREGLRILALAYEVDGHFIWGATAAILRNLVSVIAPLTKGTPS